MIPWVLLDKVSIPGGEELRLMRRGEEFSILSGPTTLMSSRMSGSEKALAELAPLSSETLIDERYNKFRRMGNFFAETNA